MLSCLVRKLSKTAALNGQMEIARSKVFFCSNMGSCQIQLQGIQCQHRQAMDVWAPIILKYTLLHLLVFIKYYLVFYGIRTKAGVD